MNEGSRSKIDDLNETLHSRTRYEGSTDERSPVRAGESPDVEDNWQTPELDEMLKQERTPPVINPFMKRIFTFSILFFIATVLVGAFMFFGGGNFISSKNVDINVVGPTSISAGEVLELGVTISNRNNADLESSNISIQYPQGARNVETSETLTFSKQELGSIRAGGETIVDLEMSLIGATGEVKEIRFSVEYKVAGSNATFYKEKVYEITIGNSPITLTIESPESITSGENFETVVSVALNSADILKGVMLRAEYPYGYSVVESNPSAMFENNVWSLGDLSPGDKKTITIRGQLTGQDGEERTFRFYTGVSDSFTVNPSFQNVIVSSQDTVAITRSSVGLNVSFNGNSSNTYMAPIGLPVSTSIRFQNNMSARLLNPRLELSLSGTALDRSSISVQNGGFYDSATNKIIWNLSNNAGGTELLPGDSGQVSFSFSSNPNLSQGGGSQDIALNFSLTGIPSGGSSQTPITVSEQRVVKITSEVNLSTRAIRSTGPFLNEGPIPPKVGERTTYTGVFNIGNTRSNISDAKVTARLGQGVTWIGASSLESEDISYDSSTNTVTWNLNTLASGTGFSTPVREVAFQLALTPTTIQLGTSPALVTSIVFTGTDTVTGSMVTVNNQALTTRLSTDPAFIQGDDIVIQ